MVSSKLNPAHFMKVYGWAVLIIVSLLATMFYFNIFDTSLVECQFEGAFGCSDSVAYVNSSHIEFFIEKQINSDISSITFNPSYITFEKGTRCQDLYVHPIIDRFEEEISPNNILEDQSKVQVVFECVSGTFSRNNKISIIGSYTVRNSSNLQSFEGYILA